MNQHKSYISKVWSLFSKERKRASLVLCIWMVISMFFETFGIGIIVPIVSIIADPNVIIQYPKMKPILERFGNPSLQMIIIFTMLFLVGVYTVRTLFMAFLSWVQASFAANFQTDLSRNLFEKYLRQSYSFHLQHNSSELIRNTSIEVSTTVSMVQQAFSLLTELLTLLGASILLIYMEPIGAIVVIGSICGAGGIFFLFTKKKILEMGMDRQNFEAGRILHIQQGLGGVKDIKLLGREKEFIERYQIQSEGCAKVVRNYTTLIALPRLWLEYLAILGLAGLVITILLQGKPVSEIVPILGLFGAAAFRIMPSINRILIIIQNIKFSLPTIELVYNELNLQTEEEKVSLNQLIKFQSTISLQNLSFQYAEKKILDQVSLQLQKGKTYGFIGESGVGKSTLIDLILGLLRPKEGEILVDGIPIQENLRSWQNNIGYVSQSIFLTDDTLQKNIAFGLDEKDIQESQLWEAIRLAQLENFVKESPEQLETRVGERGVRLSGGQRQRIGIARALYHRPSILVLDEATSSLDTETEKEVMQAVNEMHGSKTILIIAHRLSTLEKCDQIYKLENGKFFLYNN